MAQQGKTVENGVWDYIIVGAGSAGCVIAARLSQNGSRVLVLEAGPGKLNAVSRIPGLHKLAWTYPKFNWSYVSEPELHLGGRQIPVPRGKVVGGSSAINGLAFIRGCSADFDGWEEAGAQGWSFEDVLPYFRRAETSWNSDPHWHGHAGPVRTALHDGTHQFFDPIAAAANEAGIASTDDPDGAQHEGVSRMPQNIGGGVRNCTYTAYLEPALRGDKCHLVANALVSRVLLEDNKAVGVEYEVSGEMRTARAAREVILCGGAYNSPQVLMLSGIGDPASLKEHGIDPVVNLPGVGRNLQEHPYLYLSFSARDSLLTTLRMDRMALALARCQSHGSVQRQRRQRQPDDADAARACKA